ncbi:hypothetical protein [Burkholderia oklahomensis]|uniref:hypothetical protein n=1 Tax=Burkholderia oklahomensis TaxID=342113 RepID=UPI001E38CD9C|nr:hypothetical protein [Burkholderia oklahomensis]
MSSDQVRRHAARAQRLAQPCIDRLPGSLGQMIENDAASKNLPLLLHGEKSPLMSPRALISIFRNSDIKI